MAPPPAATAAAAEGSILLSCPDPEDGKNKGICCRRMGTTIGEPNVEQAWRCDHHDEDDDDGPRVIASSCEHPFGFWHNFHTPGWLLPSQMGGGNIVSGELILCPACLVAWFSARWANVNDILCIYFGFYFFLFCCAGLKDLRSSLCCESMLYN